MSSAYAFATVFGLTVSCCASPRTLGNWSPGESSAVAIFIRTASTICLLIGRGSPVAIESIKAWVRGIGVS